MPTAKVRHGGEWRCFQCNARVGEDESVCPRCGREFGIPNPEAQRQRRRLGERVHEAASSRRRGYRLTLIVLVAAAVILVALFRPRRLEKPVLPEPTSSRPEFRVVETWDLVQKGLDRMSVVALVPVATGDSLLRDVLEWVLYETLDRYNRQGDRYLRVVWAYVVEDSLASKTDWRAMAIWTDQKLDDARRPAGIGGDALEVGPVEYDFTNNCRPDRSRTGE